MAKKKGLCYFEPRLSAHTIIATVCNNANFVRRVLEEVQRVCLAAAHDGWKVLETAFTVRQRVRLQTCRVGLWLENTQLHDVIERKQPAISSMSPRFTGFRMFR